MVGVSVDMESTTFFVDEVVAGTNPFTDDAIMATITAAENFMMILVIKDSMCEMYDSYVAMDNE